MLDVLVLLVKDLLRPLIEAYPELAKCSPFSDFDSPRPKADGVDGAGARRETAVSDGQGMLLDMLEAEEETLEPEPSSHTVSSPSKQLAAQLERQDSLFMLQDEHLARIKQLHAEEERSNAAS
jgi:hypothetical protein